MQTRETWSLDDSNLLQDVSECHGLFARAGPVHIGEVALAGWQNVLKIPWLSGNFKLGFAGDIFMGC